MENQDPVFTALKKRLEATRRLAVVGIGDELSSSDRLGMTAAWEIDRQKIPGVQVFLAGTVPENITGTLRRYGPDHVLFLDAAEMGKRPGTLAIIAPGQVRARFFSTHALPLPVVMQYIEREIGAPVTLLGIQPGNDRNNTIDGDTLPYIDNNLGLLSAFLKKQLSR
jgi:hydrogenase 3 maturation protease